MKRFLHVALVAAIALGFSITDASAQQYNNQGIPGANALCSSTALVGFASGCARTIADKTAVVAATTVLTQIIAAPANGSIRITHEQYAGLESATGGALELEYGTGTNCGTGTTLYQVLAQLPNGTPVNGSYSPDNAYIVPAGKALCAIVSAGTVTYAQALLNYAIW